MGNRICRKRRSSIEERFTRPQRLVRQPSDVDYKRLRKLILSQKLAPCFDGVEDSNPELEECPICFFYYPSLNRSICCRKRVCTECFLQMKPSNAARPAQCPFCKCSSYAVEFRGAKTEEEKRKELAEEQKVTEAKMRIRRRESQNDLTLLVDLPSSNEELQSSGDSQEIRDSSVEVPAESMVSQSPERHGALNQHYEEIMIMEAIWRSLQEVDLQANTTKQSSAPSGSGEAQVANLDSNQKLLSSASFLGVKDVPPEESVIERVAVSIPRTDEPGQSTIDLTGQAPVSNSGRGYQDLKNETNSVADSGGLESEAGSEIECLASCSFTTENDPWESVSHSIEEGNQDLLPEVFSDADAAEASDGGSSFSSIHALSDRSCATLHYTDDEINPCCSILSSPVSLEQERI
ncbi:E3 ubiquitin-protein ligase DA2L-like isoform X2 [Aristolochia californica]|uniref:E3 ubiquitin-protein ligase DA2L-like isoform X2 n=1 Tax=Aristolochia californica TaxID=171875 RepID=UPI0035D718D8